MSLSISDTANVTPLLKLSCLANALFTYPSTFFFSSEFLGLFLSSIFILLQGSSRIREYMWSFPGMEHALSRLPLTGVSNKIIGHCLGSHQRRSLLQFKGWKLVKGRWRFWLSLFWVLVSYAKYWLIYQWVGMNWHFICDFIYVNKSNYTPKLFL